MTSLTAATAAFRETWTAAHPGQPVVVDDWCAFASRRGRYELYWRIYQNDIYRRIHHISSGYKAQYALYRHTRGCYSPASRIVEFGVAHLYSGPLDPLMGDGKETANCLPIVNADEATRKALARLMRDSRWATRNAVASRWGYVCGDVGVKVCDDPDKGIVALEPVHPGTVSWLKRDDQGHVIEYEILERRLDPRTVFLPGNGNGLVQGQVLGRYVEYRETAELEGQNVVYRTYLDNSLYDWTGNGATWSVAYGFVPLVWIEHIDAGLGFGMSELELGRAKIDEVNDLGSKLHDQIRKEVEGAWFFAGVPDPQKALQKTATRPTPTNPEPTRQEQTVFYAVDPAARPHSLVSPLKIAEVSAEVRQQLDSLEDDYPELRFERVRTGGTVSGEALRVARQPAAARIEQRRPAYDQGLAMAMKMALAIGAMRGYEGYQGLGSPDLQSGPLAELQIAPRPVFAVDELDKLAEKQARFTALKTATDAGLPLEIAMADLGYDQADVAEVTRLKEEAQAKMAALAPPPAVNGPPQPQPQPQPKPGGPPSGGH